jgi:phosphoribosylglycinamide formyltransferase-1
MKKIYFMNDLVNIALFASGSGTNVENIYNYFKGNSKVNIVCVLCNKPDAYVLTRAKNLGLDILVFNRQNFVNNDNILDFLEAKNVNFLVLAGFLWLIPDYLIEKFPNRIVNIHPALLPKYGGKGMYGMAVHEAVFKNKEIETGITVHFVNKNYDEGQIVFQKTVKIDVQDTPDSIANKVHALEYQYYPTVIENIAVTLQNKL